MTATSSEDNFDVVENRLQKKISGSCFVDMGGLRIKYEFDNEISLLTVAMDQAMSRFQPDGVKKIVEGMLKRYPEYFPECWNADLFNEGVDDDE